MGAFNQLNGAIFDAAAIEARISAIDGKSIYNQRDGGILDFDSLARRLTALDGKIAVGQGGIEFDVDSFMRRLAAIEAGGFNPLSLFAGGVQGSWYDPSDFATLFQDSAGTTPVTAVTQPVGKVLDKSGNGNHLIQATTTSRPTVQQDANGNFYLLFDGVDDGMATAATVNFSSTNAITLWAGATKSSDATTGLLVELGTSGASAGGFYITAPEAGATFGFIATGNVAASGWTATAAAPVSEVLSVQYSLTGASSATQVMPYLNGVLSQNGVVGGANTGTGNFLNATLYVGRRTGTTLPFNGRVYQMIARGASSISQDRVNAEKYVGAKMGIAL